VRYVPINVSGDIGDIEFGVVRALLFDDAVAVEFGYHGPWRAHHPPRPVLMDWELYDAVTARRLRPTGGGIGGSDDAALSEQWWENIGGSTLLRLRTAVARDVDVDLNSFAPVDPTIRLTLGADEPDLELVEKPEVSQFHRNLGPLIPDRVRSTDQPPIRLDGGRITPLAAVEWGTVVELVTGWQPDHPDRSPEPPSSWMIEMDDQRYHASSRTGYGHRCSADHWHAVVSFIAARGDDPRVLAGTG
jgi:hypothetical protein